MDKKFNAMSSIIDFLSVDAYNYYISNNIIYWNRICFPLPIYQHVY